MRVHDLPVSVVSSFQNNRRPAGFRTPLGRFVQV
jgi:hypothetical protein